MFDRRGILILFNKFETIDSFIVTLRRTKNVDLEVLFQAVADDISKLKLLVEEYMPTKTKHEEIPFCIVELLSKLADLKDVKIHKKKAQVKSIIIDKIIADIEAQLRTINEKYNEELVALYKSITLPPQGHDNRVSLRNLLGQQARRHQKNLQELLLQYAKAYPARADSAEKDWPRDNPKINHNSFRVFCESANLSPENINSCIKFVQSNGITNPAMVQAVIRHVNQSGILAAERPVRDQLIAKYRTMVRAYSESGTQPECSLAITPKNMGNIVNVTYKLVLASYYDLRSDEQVSFDDQELVISWDFVLAPYNKVKVENFNCGFTNLDKLPESQAKAELKEWFIGRSHIKKLEEQVIDLRRKYHGEVDDSYLTTSTAKYNEILQQFISLTDISIAKILGILNDAFRAPLEIAVFAGFNQ